MFNFAIKRNIKNIVDILLIFHKLFNIFLSILTAFKKFDKIILIWGVLIDY